MRAAEGIVDSRSSDVFVVSEYLWQLELSSSTCIKHARGSYSSRAEVGSSSGGSVDRSLGCDVVMM